MYLMTWYGWQPIPDDFTTAYDYVRAVLKLLVTKKMFWCSYWGGLYWRLSVTTLLFLQLMSHLSEKLKGEDPHETLFFFCCSYYSTVPSLGAPQNALSVEMNKAFQQLCVVPSTVVSRFLMETETLRSKWLPKWYLRCRYSPVFSSCDLTL